MRKNIILDWKKSIRTNDSQLGDIDRDRLIEHGKGIKTETLKQNESKVYTQN